MTCEKEAMNELQAQKLCKLVSDQYGPGSARIHRLGNNELVVIIKKGCWFCWNFDDWSLYRHNEKLKAKAERRREREVQRGIDTAEAYHLAMPMMV